MGKPIGVIEVQVSKRRTVLKILRLLIWTIIKRGWYLPGVSEITVDQLAERLNSDSPPLLIDLRDRKSFDGRGELKDEKYGHIPNSLWIPLFQLSSHYVDLPKDKEMVTICPGGGASLVAAEIMVKAGLEDAKILKGGNYKWHKKGYSLIITPEDEIPTYEEIVPEPVGKEYTGEIHHSLDVRDLSCPIPVLKSKKTLQTLEMGQVLEILTTDPGSRRDIPAWAHVTGQELLISEENGPNDFRFLVKRMN